MNIYNFFFLSTKLILRKDDLIARIEGKMEIMKVWVDTPWAPSELRGAIWRW